MIMHRIGTKLFAISRDSFAKRIAAAALAMSLCLLAIPGFPMQSKPRTKPRTTTRAAAPAKPAWRITENEVVAVQLRLHQQRYLTNSPTGKVDRDTRRALQAYQADRRLPVTGEIDRATYQSFKLPYPATGREGASFSGKKGYLAARPSAPKPPAAATAAGASAGGPKGLTTSSTRAAAALQSPETPPRGKGFSSVTGAVTGVTTRTTNAILLSREDEDVHSEVKEIILKNPATQNWDFSVKQGMVTVKVPPKHNANLGEVIAEIRKLAGVKSIFVVSM